MTDSNLLSRLIRLNSLLTLNGKRAKMSTRKIVGNILSKYLMHIVYFSNYVGT